MAKQEIRTEIASFDVDHIWVRGKDLTSELMGKVTFTDMTYLAIIGRMPNEQERRLLDTVLVALVEHGLTMSAAATRMTYSVAPEAIQAAVAAGLMGAGSMLLGSMENCGKVLTEIAEAAEKGEDADAVIERVVAEHKRERRPLPGMGHSIHKGGDPRAARLFQVAQECGYYGRYCDYLKRVNAVTERSTGRHLPINATGAIAAALLELGVPWQIHRGFALISRCAGLVAHVHEERTAPIWDALRTILRDAVEIKHDGSKEEK